MVSDLDRLESVAYDAAISTGVPLYVQEARLIAKAILTELLSPTQKMIEAAVACDIQAEHSPNAEITCWQAMISSILEDKQ